MSNLINAPDQVVEVHNAMCDNARKRFGDDTDVMRPVYTRPETRYNSTTYDYESTGNWIVGSNFEGWGPSMIFKEGTWFYRSERTGEDEPMRNGHSEALGNAGCFFTG